MRTNTTIPRVALDVLDAPALARAAIAYRDVLRMHQDELNRLNVYPVPDGDTGTNMALTMEAVVAELGEVETPASASTTRGAHPSMVEVCRALAHGSLMGARGNSGVILSQILRGLVEVVGERDAVRAPDLAAGLRRASAAADDAVLEPVEGTILTVARAAADAASAGGTGEDVETLVELLDRTSRAVHEAVDRTPELLDVLAAAGVVDAGGLGFALLVDALLHVVDGRGLPKPAIVAMPHLGALDHAHGVGGGRYEVMLFLDAPGDAVADFKVQWGTIGDSVVVVGGDRTWNCHVHTDDVDAAIRLARAAGTPSSINVTDLSELLDAHSHDAHDMHDTNAVHAGHGVHAAAGPQGGDDGRHQVVTGVVAVAAGDGVHRLLRSVGVHEIVMGGQSMNPSTAEILAAVTRAPGDAVVVLPNNANIVGVAGQLDDLSPRPVAVVPTRAVVEGLAALVAYDPGADVAANVAAMTGAAAGVRAGEVTRAVRAGVASCGPIAEGDWIALTSDGVVAVAGSAADAAIALCERLVDASSELVTVVVGTDARPAETERLRNHLGRSSPHVELEVHGGEQPLYPYLIGVE